MEESRRKAGGNDKNNGISTEKADEEYNTESGVLEADCNGADIGNPLSVYDLYFAGCSAHSTPCFNEHFFTLFLGAAAIMAYDAFRSRQALQKLSLLSPAYHHSGCFIYRHALKMTGKFKSKAVPCTNPAKYSFFCL